MSCVRLLSSLLLVGVLAIAPLSATARPLIGSQLGPFVFEPEEAVITLPVIAEAPAATRSLPAVRPASPSAIAAPSSEGAVLPSGKHQLTHLWGIRLDTRSRVLRMAYTEADPQVTVTMEHDPERIILLFKHATLGPTQRYGAVSTALRNQVLFTHWVIAQSLPTEVRVTIRTGMPTVPKIAREPGELVLAVQLPESPIVVLAELPAAAVASPSAPATVMAIATPSLLSPSHGRPIPAVPRPHPPSPSFVELGYRQVTLNEDYGWGGSSFLLSDNNAYVARWRQRILGHWAAKLDLQRWDPYTIQDTDVPGSDHHRTETWGGLAVEREFSLAGVVHRLSVGYSLRHIQNDSTFAAPRPSYLFSAFQLHHGPTLADEGRLALAGPVRLVGSLTLAPLTLSLLSAGAPDIGPMYGAGGGLGLELASGPFIGTLAYRYQLLRRVSGPFQTMQGPELTMGYQF